MKKFIFGGFEFEVNLGYLKILPMYYVDGISPEDRELIEAMERHSKEVLTSKDAIWKFLISAGIETEESRRKHEAKLKRKERKK